MLVVERGLDPKPGRGIGSPSIFSNSFASLYLSFVVSELRWNFLVFLILLKHLEGSDTILKNIC